MIAKRILAVILAMLMLWSCAGVVAFADDDTVFYATDDTYIANAPRSKNINYGDRGNMLFGSTYERTAYLKFDLTGVDLSAYNGALLDLNFKAATKGGKIEIHTVSSDWNEKSLTWENADKNYEFVVQYTVENEGSNKIAFTLNNALKKAKERGDGIIALVLTSTSPCINVASSEHSDINSRPKLTLTEDSAFVPGQMDVYFPEITAQDLKTEMTKVIAKGHPYMTVTPESINRIKEYAFGKDEIMTMHYNVIKKRADSILTQPVRVIPDNTASASYLGDAYGSRSDIQVLSLVYLIEGDERYAERAYKQAEYFCQADTWGTYQLIDNVQTASAVAYCYDWLYNWLTPDRRAVLADGLRKHHLDFAGDFYKNPEAKKYNTTFHQALINPSNHGLMTSSLTFISAMAIADTDLNFMTEVMSGAAKALETPFASWYPDSGWYEGVGYWGYAGPFTARYLLTLKNAFGHFLGYENVDFLFNVADFPVYAQNANGAFVWGDMGTSVDQLEPPIYVMAWLKNDIPLMKFALENCKIDSVYDAEFLLTYDPEIDYDANAEFSLDKLFRNIDIVTMRNTIDGNQATWAAMGVQEIRPNNGMMNCGSLGLNALGVDWIKNLGNETYYDGYWEQDGRRWTWYRTRAEANSCIVINPSDYGGQNIDAHDRINVFESDKGGAFAVTDLTETYKGQVKSYQRGIGLFDNRKTFVVQDEMTLTEPSEVYSFFNINESNIEILEDGKSAIISKKRFSDKKLYVTVEADKPFTLTAMAAKPLPTSPVPDSPNRPNLSTQKLAIHFDSVDSANIRATFTPYICDEELSAITCKDIVPIEQWSVPEEIASLPVLDDIKISGTSIKDFNSANRCYDVESAVDVSKVTPVYDNAKYDVKVSKVDATGSVTILVTDKNNPKNMNSYLIGVPVARVPSYVDTSSMTRLNITNTQAPVPQEENHIGNLYDDDLNTRWSADGSGIVMKLTLDGEHKLGCIAFNHYEGDTDRIQYFDVDVSLDGSTWTPVGSFESSGVTLDMEYYDLKNVKAKYIKITYQTTSLSSWNSVCELHVYGK